MNQLAYLVYGNIADIIDEARFSILSAIYHSSEDIRPNLVVLTDTPISFSDLPVAIEPIDKSEISDWYGPDNYNHRCKSNALLKIIDNAEKTVLIDADTVLKKTQTRYFTPSTRTTFLSMKFTNHGIKNLKNTMTVATISFHLRMVSKTI